MKPFWMLPQMTDQWSEIVPSTHPGLVNVRRVESKYALDFQRGKDFLGRYVFMLHGVTNDIQAPTPPSLDGIDVTLHLNEKGIYQLTLTLLNQGDADVFKALCTDLLTATASLPSTASAIGLLKITNRLLRWQSMLKKRSDSVLTKKQVIGLFGELLFLRDQLLFAITPLEAVSAWRGPFGDEQDFLLNGVIFEIKTQIETADRRLYISSEDQLDLTSGEIILGHQIISVASAESSDSYTLNSLVDALCLELSNTNAESLDLFRAGLVECAYSPRREYGQTAWTLATRTFYAVTKDFPRLEHSMLPPGVERVSYQIRVGACEPFRVSISETMKRVIHGRK